MLGELGRAFKAGELAAAAHLMVHPDGRYSIQVLRLKERRVVPSWRKPVLVAGGAVLTLAGLAAGGWWLAGLAVAAIPVALVPLLVGVAMVTGGALIRPSGHGCETTVIVRHRHR